MDRTLLATGLIGWALVLGIPEAEAQEKNPLVSVHLKAKNSKPIRARITKESIEEVTVNTRTTPIPAEDIFDIDYSNYLSDLERLKSYAPAVIAEKNGRRSPSLDDRIKELEKALAYYGAALKKIDPNMKTARRHLEFKTGYVHGMIASANAKKAHREQSIKLLSEFRKKHPDSWQALKAMRMLARMYAQAKDYVQVKKTTAELIALGVSTAAKQQMRLLLAELLMEGKQFKDAETTLRKLTAELAKTNPMRMQTRLMTAVCLAASGEKKQLEIAIADLKSLLKKATDKSVRAAAYNTLGECYFKSAESEPNLKTKQENFQQAMWQFLWVDVIYNSNKEQHAKALFYLWRIFTQQNEFERAQGFYRSLVNEPEFANSPFRARAIQMSKERS